MSKIKNNIVMEKLYIQGLVNKLYEDIAKGHETEDIHLIMESIKKEEDTKSVISDIIDDLNLSKKFLFTFGTGIGSFVVPVNNLLNGSGVTLPKESVVLLIITSIALLLGDVDFNKLKKQLESKTLYPHLKGVSELINSTKKVVNNVTSKVLNVTYSLTDILGFTFLLVPVTNLLSKLINDYGLNLNNIKELLSGVILSVTAFGVKSIIKKIKDKF
jgi:hypothetical protein|tara:strand:- start:4598 stop:5245 length:648 start_codon:yes stop_codon:yes gene_type:complete